MVDDDLAEATFYVGSLVATPGATLEFSVEEMSACLRRHVRRDWGDLDAEDKGRNDAASRNGGRLLSSYDLPGDRRLWIITEAEDDRGVRTATTLLLPSEY